jgi:hypothetical protein
MLSMPLERKKLRRVGLASSAAAATAGSADAGGTAQLQAEPCCPQSGRFDSVTTVDLQRKLAGPRSREPS